jgi:hypothetical protein
MLAAPVFTMMVVLDPVVVVVAVVELTVFVAEMVSRGFATNMKLPLPVELMEVELTPMLVVPLVAAIPVAPPPPPPVRGENPMETVALTPVRGKIPLPLPMANGTPT